MRDFSLKARFSFRSLGEITEQVAVSFARIKARRPGVEGRMSREIVFNSVFLHFASLPVEEQLRIYDSGLAKLVPLLEAPEPELPAAAAPQVADVDVLDVTTPGPAEAPSKRKGRR